MSKPHTLSLVVVESSSTRAPRVSALSTVLGPDTVTLAHERWRDEAPVLKPGRGAGIVVDEGYVHSPWTLG